MKIANEFSNLKEKVKKDKHVMISTANYESLRKYGIACESINDCITKILEQKEVIK